MTAPFLRPDDWDGKLSLLRLILSISLMVIWVALNDGSPSGVGSLSLAVLILNTAYSTGVLIRSKRARFVTSYAHWIDLGFYSALMFLDYPNHHLFLLGILFATLVAVSRGGLRSGLRFTATSVGLVVAITAASQLRTAKLDLPDVTVLIFFPTVFGLMISYWGDSSNKLERRLLFLKHITHIANPRFGVDQTLDMILQKLQTFYEAESCLLVMTDANSGKDFLHRVNHVPSPARAQNIPKGLAEVFLSLPYDHACIWRDEHRKSKDLISGAVIYDVSGQVVSSEGICLNRQLITTLEAESFITVPIICYAKSLGRLYIVNPRVHVSRQDIDFLNQVLENVMRIMENIRLVDRLATEAADHERQKIARDIHDSIVQPYIGIHMGLSAVKRKLDKGVDATRDVCRLIEYTETEISDLRTYVKGLKGSKACESNFVDAVRRLASKFEDASGIRVQVSTEKNLPINDRLAAEAFQIIAEGLSNIRRHTRATKALILIKCLADEFIILIKNDKDENDESISFLPRSISERTAALGGHVLVQQGGAGTTALNITIPL
jgi:signal transduction histidine kinase